MPVIAQLNSQIPGVVNARQQAGRKITYADFSSSYFSLADIGKHPTEARYKKLAEAWYQGITIANSRNWITEPTSVAGVSNTVNTGSNQCDKARPKVRRRRKRALEVMRAPMRMWNNPILEGVFWADIDGDGVEDYVYDGPTSDYGLGVALRQGGGAFGAYLYPTFSGSCKRADVRFADMTGDGRDGPCCLGPDGGLVCWQNTQGSDIRNPARVDVGTVKAIVDPSTNKAWTWFNVCPDGSGLVTPSLPSGAPAVPSPALPSSGATTTTTQGAGSGSGSRSDAGPSGGSGYVTIDPAL
nr:hypothetical protein B0A51_12497 [Rachicladosporium sp. CCFEE 5018]